MYLFPQVPFNTMTNRRKPKVADWLMFLRSAVPYTFYQVGPSRPRPAFQAMVEALQMLLDATADYNPDDMDDTATATCRAAKIAVARALFLLERDFPGTELSIAIHEIVHVPSFLWRWNSVRNYWCFVVERLVGFMKTFVHNRSLAVENMVMHINKIPTMPQNSWDIVGYCIHTKNTHYMLGYPMIFTPSIRRYRVMRGVSWCGRWTHSRAVLFVHG